MIECSNNFAICKIQNKDKFLAIREVIEKCSVFKELPKDVDFYKIVEQREKIETTGIGHGVAIAHGKIPSLDRVRVGLGVSIDGVEYKSTDDKPVHVLFVIASSPSRQLEYLKTLSKILSIVRNEKVRKEIFELNTGNNQCLKLQEMLISQKFC